jgi:multisubunit Na+/H+ antiporter MnhC subunit
MLLDTGTLIAIVIALACSCFVMVVSIRAQGKLLQENNSLRKELTELHYNRVKEGM